MNIYTLNVFFKSASVGFSIRWLYTLETNKTTLPKDYPGYDIKLHLMARFKFLEAGEWRVSHDCHFSEVHSDPVDKHLIRFYQWIK